MFTPQYIFCYFLKKGVWYSSSKQEVQIFPIDEVYNYIGSPYVKIIRIPNQYQDLYQI